MGTSASEEKRGQSLHSCHPVTLCYSSQVLSVCLSGLLCIMPVLMASQKWHPSCYGMIATSKPGTVMKAQL